MKLALRKLSFFQLITPIALIAGFAIGFYAMTRPEPQTIVSQASGLPDWNAVYSWKETKDLSSLPGSGTIQSLSERIVGSSMYRTLIRGDRMFSQVVPIGVKGLPDWTKAGAWSETKDLSSLPESRNIQELTQISIDSKLYRTLLANNRMYSQVVPLLPSGLPDWTKAGKWIETKDVSSLPGSGDFQALSQGYSLAYGRFSRTFLRNNHMYVQDVPLKNGLPDWSRAGAWRETEALWVSQLPGTGNFQSLSEQIIESKLYRTFIRGNRMFTQIVPVSNGVADWNKVYSWRETEDLSSLPARDNIQELSGYINGSDLYRTLLNDNRMYSQVVPLVNGLPDWKRAGVWTETVNAVSKLPGSGNIQSLSEEILNSTLYRTLLRDNKMYSQSVRLVNGKPDWTSPGEWKQTEDLSSLPGSGEFQSLSSHHIGPNLYRLFLRNNHMYSQTVPMKNGFPDWTRAGAWNETVELSVLPGEGDMQVLNGNIVNNKFYRTFVRGGHLYTQQVPLTR